LDAYPAIYLACHRRHIRDDESGAVVTAHQASVLDHLDIRKPTTLSRLAEHLGIGALGDEYSGKSVWCAEVMYNEERSVEIGAWWP
jgi:hypothetical protein